jgi:hypothetical protein
MTLLDQPSPGIHRDSKSAPSLASNIRSLTSKRITSLADPTSQLPWNDILAKNIGGGGPISNLVESIRWLTPQSAPHWTQPEERTC